MITIKMHEKSPQLSQGHTYTHTQDPSFRSSTGVLFAYKN